MMAGLGILAGQQFQEHRADLGPRAVRRHGKQRRVVAGSQDVQDAALGRRHVQRRGHRFHHLRQRAHDLAPLERRVPSHAQPCQVSGIFLAQPAISAVRDRTGHPGPACLQQAGEFGAAPPFRVPGHGHCGPSPSRSAPRSPLSVAARTRRVIGNCAAGNPPFPVLSLLSMGHSRRGQPIICQPASPPCPRDRPSHPGPASRIRASLLGLRSTGRPDPPTRRPRAACRPLRAAYKAAGPASLHTTRAGPGRAGTIGGTKTRKQARAGPAHKAVADGQHTPTGIHHTTQDQR